MFIEEPGVARVSPRTDDMDEISLVRLHVDGDVLPRIHERPARWRRRTIRGLAAVGLVGVEHGWHLLVIPIGQGEGNLLVEMERRVRIVDDQRTPEPVWELAEVV